MDFTLIGVSHLPRAYFPSDALSTHEVLGTLPDLVTGSHPPETQSHGGTGKRAVGDDAL